MVMGWIRVSRLERCPVCGKPDWCQRTADGTAVHCMRVESAKPANGPMGGWIHRLGDPMPCVTEQPKRTKPSIDWGLLAQSMFETGAEERYYLSKSLGLKEAALVELQVGRGWDDYRGVSYSSWPERDAKGKVVGIVRRYRDGSKKTMRHSSHGLYYAAKWWERPGPVYLVEGGSCCAAALSFGGCVVGRPSNLGGVDLLKALLVDGPRGRQIFVVGERDEKLDRKGGVTTCAVDCSGCAWCHPGLFGARHTAHKLSVALRRKVYWSMPNGFKDCRDWYVHQDGPDSVIRRKWLAEMKQSRQ